MNARAASGSPAEPVLTVRLGERTMGFLVVARDLGEATCTWPRWSVGCRERHLGESECPLAA